MEAKPRPESEGRGDARLNINVLLQKNSRIYWCVRHTNIQTGTFKEGCDVPSRDPSLLHELTQCNLQEEDWDASDEHDQQVGDQENPYKTSHGM